jgi:type I restriction enzyme S subunit
VSSGIPFLLVSNIKRNKIDYTTEKYISEKEFEILNRRTPIEVGNILITTVGSYGNPAIIETDTKFAFQRHIAFLKPKHDLINYVFLFSILKTDFVKRQIDKKVIGVAQKTLNLNSLSDINIIYPPITLQNQFAEQIQNIEQQKEKLKLQMQESENLFQALLQKAFNGGLN